MVPFSKSVIIFKILQYTAMPYNQSGNRIVMYSYFLRLQTFVLRLELDIDISVITINRKALISSLLIFGQIAFAFLYLT